MRLMPVKDISIVISSFFVKCVGFWLASSPSEQRLRNITLIYTVFNIIFSVWIQTRDFYYSWGDFGTCTYIACNILCLNIALFKTFILFLHKEEFLALIVYMQKNFWTSDYSPHEKRIYASWKRICTYFICIFTFFTEASIVSYAVRPIVANIGRNESDRILPFNMWLDLPLSMSPYFEITFILQVLALCHIGVCYICFDNFLCMMNLHVAAQFRILQHRFKYFHKSQYPRKSERSMKGKSYSCIDEYYVLFKKCIQQHQALIAYCRKLEDVFRTVVLAQVLTFSLLLCFVGYQVLLADISATRRFTFVNLLFSNLCHLFMFTYSCDCLRRESSQVAVAVYTSPWLDLPMNKNGRGLRQDVRFIVLRSSRPCTLTANGFFPISLETYTSIMSSAMSYFTILRQNSMNTETT
ncbi:odorant receptor 10-like [Calliopsis andreniformis]|uniref:odorant receptor 10-like n=1 Tax=Calliopsis andreniformis TaxID=337506 RepID=UPI003FCE9011